jgi:DNA-binding NtrC family response regulator
MLSEGRMSSIVLIGSDHALLEGLAQTLAAAGFRVDLALGVDDANAIAGHDPPLMVVVDRDTALAAWAAARSPTIALAPGGSVVLYHATDDGPEPLPASLQRLTLADLTLPLERQRLVALVQTVSARARSRGQRPTGESVESSE